MKKIIFSILAMSLFSCVSNRENQFMDIYQSELCDKYSLYANNKDLNGILSLYTDDAVMNGNAVDAIIGKEAIKSDFIKWFENADSIDHRATVISANVFGNKAFVYGRWELSQISKDGKKIVDKTGNAVYTLHFESGHKIAQKNIDFQLNGVK